MTDDPTTGEPAACSPAPPSEAEHDALVLLRAAAILVNREIRDVASVTVQTLRDEAAVLRAAPQEKREADVFEAFAAQEPALDLRAKIRARDWFGPLVEALEKIGTLNDGPLQGRHDRWRREAAIAALSLLRSRAEARS